MIIAILGDTHIPDRAEKIPSWIAETLEDLMPDRIIFTGDATEYSVLFYLEEIAPTYAVKGNLDYLDLPNFIKVNLAGFNFLIIHGHQFGRGNYQALVNFALANGPVDFLIAGHTHRQETFKLRGVWVVNPGSATGAYSGAGFKPPETMTILDLEEMVIEELRGGKDGKKAKRIEIKDKKEA